ncbi:polysaccharide export protein [Sphingomonas rhizophila]|uniref:Polysaccharide export protein n=1 Tax=Sphingomonas rhizophila TaxID=2071607 RepID=A0A7G9SCY0_9SPHN|nr:polysaccharide biosynthesis/export family protein [Sphingomonas rhizophila]QNN65705.1 polysaccharide export protein [Sphingomonas rhizophila]
MRNSSVRIHAFKAVLPIIALGAAMSGCADKRGGPIAYDVGNFRPPDAPTVVALEQGYKIAPLDTVTVKVFKMADLTGDYEVDLAGNISMPLIGEVKAIDMTTAQLDDVLTKQLGDKYLERPDVSVGMKASTRRSVTIDGAVKSAGSFPVNGPMTLMQALALAGGASEDANIHRVAIFRTIDGRRQAAAFDLADIRQGKSPDPAIYAGDIVVIDGSRIKELQKRIMNNLSILSVFRPF